LTIITTAFKSVCIDHWSHQKVIIVLRIEQSRHLSFVMLNSLRIRRESIMDGTLGSIIAFLGRPGRLERIGSELKNNLINWPFKWKSVNILGLKL
jgi:hypothetical protein